VTPGDSSTSELAVLYTEHVVEGRVLAAEATLPDDQHEVTFAEDPMHPLRIEPLHPCLDLMASRCPHGLPARRVAIRSLMPLSSSGVCYDEALSITRRRYLENSGLSRISEQT
jgi:hypothetical protein